MSTTAAPPPKKTNRIGLEVLQLSRAARRRSAPVAATTPFPSASSSVSASWASSRGRWRSSPASAARRSRPPTS